MIGKVEKMSQKLSTKSLVNTKKNTFKEDVKLYQSGKVNGVIIDSEHPDSEKFDLYLFEHGCLEFAKKFGTRIIVNPGNESQFFD